MTTEHRIIRRPEVSRLTGLSFSTIDRHEHAGTFPTRVRLGQCSIGWYAHEVDAWLRHRERIGGGQDKALDATAR